MTQIAHLSLCLKSGIELIKVDAAYTSVIGTTKYMAVSGLNSGCAAALVIARRGQGRTERLPASLSSYFKKPEDLLKSGAWSKVAKNEVVAVVLIATNFIVLVSNRYELTVRCTASYGKQKSLVGVILYRSSVTPHIRQKPRAVGSPDLKGLNP